MTCMKYEGKKNSILLPLAPVLALDTSSHHIVYLFENSLENETRHFHQTSVPPHLGIYHRSTKFIQGS